MKKRTPNPKTPRIKYVIKNDLNFSLSSKHGKVRVATKSYILQLTGEEDSYLIEILNPVSYEVELKFRILKNDEEQSFKTLLQYLWLPPRLMEEVLERAKQTSVEEAFMDELKQILLFSKRAIELYKFVSGGETE
jgi:hypothetical protein